MKNTNSALTKIYPNGLTGKEIIHRITEIYHAGYDLDNLNFDIYEQLLVCESLAETEAEEQKKHRRTNENGSASVSGNANGTHKREVKSELNWYQSGLIYQLKRYASDTPKNEIATLLEEIFKTWPSNKEGHWLWIAQTYTTRTINWVMSATVKKYLQGGIRKTPPAYFTYLLKFRKKRKEFRNTNDTR